MEFQLKHATEILRRTPSTLNSLLRHLPDEWVLPNEGLQSWSPYDVEGLALFLLADSLLPAWQKKVFGKSAVSIIDLLQKAIGRNKLRD